MLVGSHDALPASGTVFLHFVRTTDSFTGFRSQLKTYVRKTFVAGQLSAPLIPLYRF